MPNRSSKAGHIPQRSCVICRKKNEKDKMMRFVLNEGDIIIDYRQRLNMRGYYTCDDNGCILLLDKWLKKKSRRGN